VPLSNLVCDANSGRSQAAHANVPLRFSALSALEYGCSVPWRRSTLYCALVRSRRQSASDFSISNEPAASTFRALHPARSGEHGDTAHPGQQQSAADHLLLLGSRFRAPS